MEELEQEEFVEGYKIKAGREYIIRRQEYGGRVFYKIFINQKQYDGTLLELFKIVKFKGSPDIPDFTRILIKKFVENGYYSTKDTNHYNPQWALTILDWDIVEQSHAEINSALNQYNNSNNDDFLPF